MAMDSNATGKRTSPLKSGTKKKVLSAASRQSKTNYDKRRAGSRIYIGYAVDKWRQLRLDLGLKNDADMAHFLVTSNDTEAKLHRYKRKRRKNDPPCRCTKTEHQSTPTSLASNDSERKPAADLHTEATVPKAVHDDLKQMYSQLSAQCDSLHMDINKLKAENEQFKMMIKTLCHYSPD